MAKTRMQAEPPLAKSETRLVAKKANAIKRPFSCAFLYAQIASAVTRRSRFAVPVFPDSLILFTIVFITHSLFILGLHYDVRDGLQYMSDLMY